LPNAYLLKCHLAGYHLVQMPQAGATTAIQTILPGAALIAIPVGHHLVQIPQVGAAIAIQTILPGAAPIAIPVGHHLVQIPQVGAAIVIQTILWVEALIQTNWQSTPAR
jgi:hypothetical protein